jgi:hypothetical protein
MGDQLGSAALLKTGQLLIGFPKSPPPLQDYTQDVAWLLLRGIGR